MSTLLIPGNGAGCGADNAGRVKGIPYIRRRRNAEMEKEAETSVAHFLYR